MRAPACLLCDHESSTTIRVVLRIPGHALARCTCVGRATRAVAGAVEDKPDESEPVGPVEYDFAYEKGQFYYKGTLLQRCDPVSKWVKVIGSDYRTSPYGARGNGAHVSWGSLGLGCRTTRDEQRIKTCEFHFRWNPSWGTEPASDRYRYHTKHVLVDGAAIGPNTKVSQLNRGKRGAKFRVGWYPQLYETRTEKNIESIVGVEFTKKMEVAALDFGVHKCEGDDFVR